MYNDQLNRDLSLTVPTKNITCRGDKCKLQGVLEEMLHIWVKKNLLCSERRGIG